MIGPMVRSRFLPWALGALVLASLYLGCSGDEEDDGATGSSQSTSSSSSSSSSGSGASGSGASGAEGGDSAGGSDPGGMGGGGPVGGGGGAGTGGDGSGGTGSACVWPDAANTCGPGNYCNAPGCVNGTCMPIPSSANESSAKSPVCGCDGADYWNDTVAASHGMSVLATGQCGQGLFCGGFANIQCPAKLFCSYGGPDQNVCFISDGGGACWGMPAVCPMIAIGPITRACGDLACSEECGLIKLGVSFYEDPSCPQ